MYMLRVERSIVFEQFSYMSANSYITKASELCCCLLVRYVAKVVEVQAEEAEVLVHFERWNSRYDEYVKMSSHRLRVLPSARSEALQRQTDKLKKVSSSKNSVALQLTIQVSVYRIAGYFRWVKFVGYQALKVYFRGLVFVVCP